ncbi:SGF29 tudor-like domain-containing protein [Chytriomyces sp. MP71]|nr:SGF29 tudor-like domain-containing protein [Chytriomyces sp. MP71]
MSAVEDWPAIAKKMQLLDECRKLGDAPIARINKIHKKILTTDKFNAKVGKKLLESYNECAVKANLEKKLITELVDELRALEAAIEGGIGSAAAVDSDFKKKKRKADEKAGSVNLKKSKTDDDASEPLPAGSQVVVRPQEDFILANIIAYRDDRQKYEVEDAEEDEDKPGTRKKYLFNRRQIIPIPGDASALPKEFGEGHTVLALYPGTTCFYKATVMVPPSKGSMRRYYVRFEDDGDTDREVSDIRFCLDYPKSSRKV